jgi:hypothetical protein
MGTRLESSRLSFSAGGYLFTISLKPAGEGKFRG